MSLPANETKGKMTPFSQPTFMMLQGYLGEVTKVTSQPFKKPEKTHFKAAIMT